MYVLYSKNRPSIVPHQCNSLELVDVVKNYIESRYDCEILINNVEGFVYYDYPSNIKSIKKELYNIDVEHVSVRIDDVDMLMDSLTYKDPDFTKGFMRIPSFRNHICLTEKEFTETVSYIKANEEYLNNCIKEATDIIIGNK